MMIRGADAKIVAVRHRIDRREHEENFELIVKAVNSHEALVSQLSEAVGLIYDLLGLEKGSGEAALAFLERINASVSGAKEP
jgi:hypothetical protein